MGKSIFEVITEYGINTNVNNILLQDVEYQQIQDKIDGLTNEFDALGLPKEQRLIADRLISAYNENGAVYGKMTYQQGFRDCASLLLDIGMVKDGKEEVREDAKIGS